MNNITHVVSFSGGRSSRRLVHLIEAKRKKENIKVEYIFMDTGAEDPETYNFIRNIVKFYNIELTCIKAKFGPLGVGTTYEQISVDDIKYDLSIWKAMIVKYSTPYNPGGAFCTDQLKGIPCKKYLKDKYPKSDFIEWWGIRADEPSRLKEKKGVHYLAELCDFEKEDVTSWSEKQEIDLDMEDSDITGNCVFCIKRRPNKIALATKRKPELAIDFIEMIDSPEVRIVEGRIAAVEAMYRGKLSLKSIMSNALSKSEDELKQAIRGMGGNDAGSCSESCESINSEGKALTIEMKSEQ